MRLLLVLATEAKHRVIDTATSCVVFGNFIFIVFLRSIKYFIRQLKHVLEDTLQAATAALASAACSPASITRRPRSFASIRRSPRASRNGRAPGRRVGAYRPGLRDACTIAAVVVEPTGLTVSGVVQ